MCDFSYKLVKTVVRGTDQLLQAIWASRETLQQRMFETIDTKASMMEKFDTLRRKCDQLR